MIRQYVANLGLWLNQTVCTFAGFDPRLTISAICYLKDWGFMVRLINWLFRDPDHCKNAAFGWDAPEKWGGLYRENRSLW